MIDNLLLNCFPVLCFACLVSNEARSTLAGEASVPYSGNQLFFWNSICGQAAPTIWFQSTRKPVSRVLVRYRSKPQHNASYLDLKSYCAWYRYFRCSEYLKFSEYCVFSCWSWMLTNIWQEISLYQHSHLEPESEWLKKYLRILLRT